MIRLIIADDDTIVRTSIKTMVEWGREGIEIVAEAANGKQVLETLEHTPADVLLTDIKMPLMDGLALLESLSSLPNSPVSVVLSAYDEFPMVRRAFTLGAVDYLLKSEMNAAGLVKCVKAAITKAKSLPVLSGSNIGSTPAQRFKETVLSSHGPALPPPCVLACFELDDYENVQKRFGEDLELNLVKPLLELSGQVHRVALNGLFCSLSPSRYLLGFRLSKESMEQEDAPDITDLCQQIIRNWKVYMNLSASVGLSTVAVTDESVNAALAECLNNVSMRIVLGPGQLLSARQYGLFDLPYALSMAESLLPLLEALKTGNDLLLNELRTQLFAPLFHQSIEQAHQLALAVIYHCGLFLSSLGTSLSRMFGGEEFNYVSRVARLDTVKQCEILIANFLRHIADFLSSQLNAPKGDVMEQAQRFLLDQYPNPLLSVRLVADAVGLSEKYFSTRFNKTFHTSVSAFVNSLRVSKARELLQRSDLKVYEIADMVGFRNTEHFIRVFTKQVGVSPSVYKKSSSNKTSTNRT